MTRLPLHPLLPLAKPLVRIGLSAMLASTLAWTANAQAQETALPTPQSGIWVLKNRADTSGSPGRSLAIDVQNGVVLAQIGDYDADGKPTFFVTAGALQADAQEPQSVSAMQAPLQQYEGGRSIGGPAQSAHLLGTAGTLALRFSNSFTGTAQFPGEPPQAIERIQLDTRRTANLEVTTVDAFTGQLHGVDGPPDMLRDSPFLLNVTRLATSGALQVKLQIAQESMPEPLACNPVQPSTAAALDGQSAGLSRSLNVHCTGQLPEQGMRVELTLHIVANEVLGQLQYSKADAQGQTQWANAQLRGARHFYETNHLRTGESLYYAYSNADPQYVVPQSGIWVIPEELNGEPGRGFAIDVEGDTLALQVFGYETSGEATFHVGSSPFTPGYISQIALRQPFASGEQNPGKASLSFDSMSSGTIALPGEPARKIVRFPLAGPPDARSLSGLWRFNVPGKAAVSAKLTEVQEHTIYSDDGLFNCAFVPLTSTQGLGNTLCTRTPAPDEADQTADQFIFNWELGQSDLYGYYINPANGAATGTGISRIAYLGRDAAAARYFSVGSSMYLPLRNGTD